MRLEGPMFTVDYKAWPMVVGLNRPEPLTTGVENKTRDSPEKLNKM